MEGKPGTAEDWEREVRDLRARLLEAEAALRAAQQGDAFALEGPDDEPEGCTLRGGDRAYRLALETMPVGVLMVTPQGLICYSNPRFAELLRMPRQDVVGSRFQDFVAPDSQADFEQLLAIGLDVEAVTGLALYASDGRPIAVQARLRSLHLDQPMACMVVKDLTDAESMEEHARAAVVTERTRIAREIHDTLAQGFTGVIIQLEAAQDALSGEPEIAREHIETAQALARESLAETRRSVWALRPRTLEQADLYTALVQVVGELTREPPIRIELTRDGVPRPLRHESEDHLLRITQEALANALKHAGASVVRVNLTFRAQEVQLCVEDDGGGFDPSTEGGTGFGLQSMRERAEVVGGRLVVSSQPGKGTRVVAFVPLPNHEGASRGDDQPH